MSNTSPFIVSVIAGSSFFATVGAKREYKTKVIWTNNAPNDHVRALTAHDSRMLKKIYGDDPLEDEPAVENKTTTGGRETSSLEPDRYLVNLPIHDSNFTGGADETPSQNAMVASARGSSTSDPEMTKSSTSSASVESFGGDDEFSLESLGEALSSSSQTAREKEMRRMFQARFAPTKQLSYSREIITVKDVWVLEEDNLMVLKRKIQLATGIPTYRQHLWYETPGAVVSPCYTLRREAERVDTNIWNIRNIKSMVQGMPVNSDMYAQRASLSVRNNEFSTTLEMIATNSRSIGSGGECGDNPNIRWYVVDINDFISDREQLSITIRNDIHMRELIYYGFILQYWPGIPSSIFQTFVTNEPLLHDEYPEFALSDSLLTRQYGTETSIIATNPQPKVKDIPMNIYLSSSDIGIVNEYYSYGAAVNVRGLFDSFRLSANIPYMIARFALGGRTHTLIKSFSSGRGPSKRRIPGVDTVCIFIVMPSAEALVYVHSSGTYHTEIIWREDLRIDIDSAKSETVAVTNGLISQINALGETVVARPLVSMTEHNINILNTNIVISIGRRLGPMQFEGLLGNANLFKRAGMLNITSSEANTFMFHFYKGMHVYDDARFEAISNSRNSYEYTTNIIVQQRHDGIYGRQKLTTITARNTDIYIHATGIKFSEYAAFVKFMLILIEMPLADKSKIPQKTATTSGIKAVSQLRELDPVLYDLKKLYGNKTMYSQICQKPNQPIIVDKPGPKSIKFWNFTRKEPAYYECPSSKFGTLYFKTGVHPAGFCIPCCKKITVTPGSKHDQIFATCMQDHSYDSKTKNTVPRSGYIISYTPQIDPGRISYLPEASLDQLFYQQFSTTGHSVDSECIPDLGYYMFGIDQTVGSARYVGVISSLAHALELPVAKFISETMDRILKKPGAWPLLLGGKISSNFKDETQFIGAAESLFGSGDVATSMFNDFGISQWNDVFLDIARVYWDVNIITFLDSGDGNVMIKVPRGIKRAEELISSQHKHMFLISAPLIGARLPGQTMEITSIVYNPIYQIDTRVFKKESKIAMTLFSSTDRIMTVIGKMLTSLISGSISAAENAAVDLDEIISFLDSGGAYKLKSILVNRNNLCYGVMITGPAAGDIYFPIMISLHDHLDVTREDAEFMRKNYNIPWSEMEMLLTAFNTWAAKRAAGEKKSASADVKKIWPQNWLLLGDQIIGFQDAAGRYNYYISPVSFDDARKIAAVPAIRMKYDPTEINALINTRAPAYVDPDLGQHLYKHHGYQLFVLEFVASLDQKRNAAIRSSLTKIINRDIKTPSAMLANLSAALVDWSRDYDRILSIFGTFTKVRECRLDEYSRLLTKSAADGFSSEILNEIIEQSRFEFDDTIMTEMFEMPAAAVFDHLTKTILPEIIEVADVPRVAMFPAGLRTCGTSGVATSSTSSDLDYCRGKKLIVSPRDYATWSKQLALDIKNPLKQRKLAALMTHLASNEFSFTSHPGETIYISLG